MEEVNQSELAKKLGVTRAMISKYVKSGILDKCFTQNGKKLYLEKAIQSITLSKKRESPKNKINVLTPLKVKEDDNLSNEQNINELEKLVSKAQSPSQEVQIVKDYWLGKINRQKFLEQEGELISVNDAKKTFEMILTPFNHFLNDLPSNLKNNYPTLPTDVIDWLENEINMQKEQLRVTNWEN